MATYARVLGTERHIFEDLRSVLACASALRSGDELAAQLTGIALKEDAPGVDAPGAVTRSVATPLADAPGAVTRSVATPRDVAPHAATSPADTRGRRVED
jgi:hypothetical protein